MSNPQSSKILDTCFYLPEKVVQTSEFLSENPTWNIEKIEEKSGVLSRHIAGRSETALDLAEEACKELLSRHPDSHDSIDGLIFCTQSPDYIMPPNSCVLHERLELPDSVLAFDFTLACSGYVYGLAMANSFIKSGQLNRVLLVTADTYSKYIHPKDRATRTLFGDGAAASLIIGSADKGIRDILCTTHGKDHDRFMIPAGGNREPIGSKTKEEFLDKSGNVRSLETIFMDGLSVLNFSTSKVPRVVKQLLQRNELSVEDIDLFIFHQASKMAIDALARVLKVPDEKCFTNIRDKGNLVSSSIPVALAESIEQGVLKENQKVLLVGFGVGLSIGVALIDF